MMATAPLGLVRLVLLLALPAALSACAGIYDVRKDPDFLLCEQARAQARAGNSAGAEATIASMRDLREAWYCKNYLLEVDKGLFPEAT